MWRHDIVVEELCFAKRYWSHGALMEATNDGMPLNRIFKRCRKEITCPLGSHPAFLLPLELLPKSLLTEHLITFDSSSHFYSLLKPNFPCLQEAPQTVANLKQNSNHYKDKNKRSTMQLIHVSSQMSDPKASYKVTSQNDITSHY